MYKNKKISLIACIDKNNAIGYRNELLFKIPEDLKRFKDATLGKSIIMGKKTYESIGKPLLNRQNIVLTKHPDQTIKGKVYIAEDIDQAVLMADYYDIFIIGGESVYRQFLPFADELLLTEVDGIVEKADSWFPEFDRNEWKLIESIESIDWSTIRYNRYIRK